jgi:hypothetical protein
MMILKLMICFQIKKMILILKLLKKLKKKKMQSSLINIVKNPIKKLKKAIMMKKNIKIKLTFRFKSYNLKVIMKRNKKLRNSKEKN